MPDLLSYIPCAGPFGRLLIVFGVAYILCAWSFAGSLAGKVVEMELWIFFVHVRLVC